MTKLNINWNDGTDYTAAPERGLMPAGQYLAQAVDSAVKPTKKGDGQYVEYVFEILDEAFKGRKLWSIFNIDNPNPTAMRIGRQELRAFATAAGLKDPNNLQESAELHYKPVRIKLVIEDGKGNYADKNVIKGFAPVKGQLVTPAAAANRQRAATAAANPFAD